jgi:hypothetical protein
MDHGEDARARELNNLRLALAMFALQLDTFELRAGGALLAADKRFGQKGLRFGQKGFEEKGFGKRGLGKNDWPSIKSPGNKSDT